MGKPRAAMTTGLGIAFALNFGLISGGTAQNAAAPDWIADIQTGCRVWNANPQPDESVTWSGPCANQLAQGRGTLQWFRSGLPTSRYEGEFRDGKRNGTGIVTYGNGMRFEGEYRDNRLNGSGTYTDSNGNRYAGEFRDGKPALTPKACADSGGVVRRFFDQEIRGRKPAYPEEARKHNREGKVVVRVRVASDGRPMSAFVINPSEHPGLDRAARDAVALWCFPGIPEATGAVAYVLDVPVEFKLR
jgi:TonB family protein